MTCGITARILPAGPGARSLAEFFASIDEKLDPAAAPAPRTQRSDRDVLNLLTKRAKVLHLGPANYCWFTDPFRALCLRLAGTPTADRPLIGMWTWQRRSSWMTWSVPSSRQAAK
ncbi:hypothetical protein [Streptomyces sp. NBC_01618]|uniref:hypothetical protein n=1 Tax=Streptomyces sp. NBC_01618 TaxID=2975900 RepID=UPI00386E4C5F|nr:hypothetical protein OH735_01055 [Streptomyces sp. NBC_01618]